MIRGFLEKIPFLYRILKKFKCFLCEQKIKSFKKMNTSEMKKVISKMYLSYIGREMNWDSPTAYTEKIQIEKLNPTETKSNLTDKYLVRDWVSKKIGDKYLIPILGVWDSFDEICFDDLPQQFVLKTNHGSGTNIIVKDKSALDVENAKKTIDKWMKTDFAYSNGFEMHYAGIKRKIIAEKYMESKSGELQDYKFLCFNGEPVFCWVDSGRYTEHHTRTVFDMNWERQPWTQSCDVSEHIIDKPENFELMKEIVTTLCQGFSHVRVDLYNISGDIFFGEMTFTNGSGFDRIIPDKYDFELGSLWN